MSLRFRTSVSKSVVSDPAISMAVIVIITPGIDAFARRRQAPNPRNRSAAASRFDTRILGTYSTFPESEDTARDDRLSEEPSRAASRCWGSHGSSWESSLQLTWAYIGSSDT